MAAVWRLSGVFVRSLTRKIKKIPNEAADFGGIRLPAPISVPAVDYSNYASSPFVTKIEEQYEYDILKKPPEWKYVERLLPFDTIPDPAVKDKYSSGWIAPKEEAKQLPYFIPRSKNHFLKIYLDISFRGCRKITAIRHIEGDIWLLNDEIKAYLNNKYPKYIETMVHEFARFIEVKGDYVEDIRKWAIAKGF